jgi:hypothetical protein
MTVLKWRGLKLRVELMGRSKVACFGVGHGFGVDAGMENRATGKASVCNGIWEKWIGKRHAVKATVSKYQALRSDG